MKKRMLADVLWEAANLHLLNSGFSCIAVADALQVARENAFPGKAAAPWRRFLERLGCPANAFECAAWDWLYDEGPDYLHDLRIDARYMWLLLAMHVAEDEGVTL